MRGLFLAVSLLAVNDTTTAACHLSHPNRHPVCHAETDEN
jgi:hypothetical protein